MIITEIVFNKLSFFVMLWHVPNLWLHTSIVACKLTMRSLRLIYHGREATCYCYIVIQWWNTFESLKQVQYTIGNESYYICQPFCLCLKPFIGWPIFNLDVLLARPCVTWFELWTKCINGWLHVIEGMIEVLLFTYPKAWNFESCNLLLVCRDL